MALGPLLFLLLLLGCAARRPVPAYDLVIAGGTIYDGLGGAPLVDEVVVKDDRIAYVGPEAPGRAARTIDAAGLAVTPGFINMLSCAWRISALSAEKRRVTQCRKLRRCVDRAHPRAWRA